MSSDARLTLARDGVADIRLKEQVEATDFRQTRPHHINVAIAPVLREPRFDAGQETEGLFGQNVDVLLTEGAFSLGQLDSGYVGWLHTDTLGAGHRNPTHRVIALGAPLFIKADLKSTILDVLSLNSSVTVSKEAGDYVQTEYGFVHQRHVVKATENYSTDPVTIAAQVLGRPYIWGGNSVLGMDCSGLVQMAYWACDRDCPRDADQQQVSLGHAIDSDAPLQRGDLIFWSGHVGIMADSETLLHSNAYHMGVAREPLNAATRRIEKSAGPIIAIKRG